MGNQFLIFLAIIALVALLFSGGYLNL